MLIKAQDCLIKLLLEPIAKLFGKATQKTKDILFICGLVMLVLLQFANSSGVIYLRFLFLFAPFCLSMGLMILGGLKTNLKAVKLNLPLAVCWFGMVLCMVVSGLVVSLDYLAHAVIWGAVFPVFFIVWANNDFRRLIDLIIKSVEISFIIFLSINFLFFEFATSEYRGLFMNPNGTGAYCAVVFVCALFRILNTTGSIKKILFPCFILGTSFANIIYSSSRGSMVTIFGAFVFAITAFIIIHRKEFKKFFLEKLLPIGLSSLILFAIFPTVFKLGFMSLPFLQNNIIIQTVNKNIEKYPQAFGGPYRGIPDYDPYSSSGSLPDELDISNDGVLDRTMNQFNVNGGISAFSNGRIELWKLYSKELTLFGNPTDKEIINSSGEVEIRESHLTYLQFSYEFGILTGIFFLAYNAISAWYAFKFFLKNKGKNYSSFPIILAVGYGILSFIEVMMSPVTRLIIAVYLLGQTHIITNKLSESVANEEDA